MKMDHLVLLLGDLGRPPLRPPRTHASPASSSTTPSGLRI